MKFKRVNYKIHDAYLGYRDVTGYAVGQDVLRVRIAVRAIARNFWACDHWDAGYRVCIGATREKAALAGLKAILEKQVTGQYEGALARAKQQGCLSFDMSGATKQ